MKTISSSLLLFATLIFISACNNSVDRFSVLKKCMVLGDESIIYARAHYVKLFYHYNPNKFSESYKQIDKFDPVTHRNTIDTYTMAIERIMTDKKIMKDNATEILISACKSLSVFSKQFVEEDYKLALNHISKNAPLTDDFFIEINRIVKFDHNIGAFDSSKFSFKQKVDGYEKAVSDYIDLYRKDIPTEFIKKQDTN